MQISARQPAATAMAAMTMDHLSGGRFILGLGASGPQVVEGWYGRPYEKPLARTREYIGILRDIWARRGPVENDGPYYPLPLPDGTGLGKPLKSSIHPLREDIPIFLGAEGPKNIAMCAELCDGWLAMLFSPEHEDLYWARCRRASRERAPGAASRTSRSRRRCPLIVSDDLDAAVDALRPFYALYFGGMGAKGANFHANVPIRMGYEKEVLEIQDLYLAGARTRPAGRIPAELIQQLSLVGSREKIRDDLERWRESIVTTLLVSGDAATLRARGRARALLTARALSAGRGAPVSGRRGRRRAISRWR